MKKYGSMQANAERREEHHHEDVLHALLRVERADLDDLVRVLDRGLRLRRRVELDVRLDELDRAVRAGRDRLRRRAGEPVDRSRRRRRGRAGTAGGSSRGCRPRSAWRPFVTSMIEREDHRRGADDGGADEHRLRGRLERVARAVVLLEERLGLLEVGLELEVLLDLLLDAFAASRSARARRPTARCPSPDRTSRPRS